jgi:hypothetical protein
MDQVIRSAFGRKPRTGRVLLSLAIVSGLVLPFVCRAADDSLEYQVKAAFLLNFTKFIEWPSTAFENAESPIAICILGDDPFGNTLSQIVAGEVVGGRKVTVQKTKRSPPPKSCQVLFVSSSEKDVHKTLPGLGAGVLTVGEGESFVREGGMIAFVLENRHVRFEINQSVAGNAGLKLSSKLLSVATAVEQ